MYPNNKSEKPVLQDIIDGLKTKNNIVGKTIHVADKELTLSQAKRNDFVETGKYMNSTGKERKKATTSLNYEAIEKDLKLAGYNLLVTSETEMRNLNLYSTYHNLWRIEKSFKIMKSDLDALIRISPIGRNY